MLTRRQFVRGSCTALGLAWANHATRLSAMEDDRVEVAYAGSMTSIMEGALKSACAQSLKVELRGRASGSNALAQLIVGGSIRPDIFLPVTPGPALSVLRASKASWARPIARTEMVIAYSPKSRFAPKFETAAKGKTEWWRVLQERGLRFGRTDPATDPQGRNIIFLMMLAEKIYGQRGLVERTLGETTNPQQIFSEPTVEARLQSGELDAASAYRIQPGPFSLPFITLPNEINLSGEDLPRDVSLSVGGKTYTPEPLIFYSLILKDAPNGKAAARFAEWLPTAKAQSIFGRYGYDPPGKATELRA